ncbi:MAG: DUF2238 domain-containing protein [Gammaproteobacteria bacterium]|nr:DUF2238 domain-containing protein [Gammaproteobacteria bacterium]
MAKEADSNARFLVLLLTATLIILLWSNIAPKDRTTWFMEVLPVLIALPILTYTWQSFPLTRLLYLLIFFHGLILMVGGHYTYADVPVGIWFQEAFDLERNHYDRLGHFAQGFVPAILAREILLRKTTLLPGKMLFFIVASISLAISAFYELIEWWAALQYGGKADAFLSTQGDIWDTQWDMFLALVGAITALSLLSNIHDRQLENLESK